MCCKWQRGVFKKEWERRNERGEWKKISERFSDLIYQGKKGCVWEYDVTYIEKGREVITYGLRHRTLIPGFTSSFHVFRESKQEAKRQRKLEISGAYWHQYSQWQGPHQAVVLHDLTPGSHLPQSLQLLWHHQLGKNPNRMCPSISGSL